MNFQELCRKHHVRVRTAISCHHELTHYIERKRFGLWWVQFSYCNEDLARNAANIYASALENSGKVVWP